MSDEVQGTPPAAPPPPAEVPPSPPAEPTPPPSSAPAASTEGPSDTGKILSAIGYIIPVVALVAILIDPYKNERFVRHHAIQALGLWVVMFVASIINVLPVLGTIIWAVVGIAVFIVEIMGAIKAFQGEWWEVPLVYGIVKQYI